MGIITIESDTQILEFPRPAFPKMLKMPKIPRAFVEHEKFKDILCTTASIFNQEELEAIHVHCILGLPVNKISKLTELTPNHVASVLGLYSERLELKLRLFKKAIPYDADDLLPVSEILLIEISDSRT